MNKHSRVMWLNSTCFQIPTRSEKTTRDWRKLEPNLSTQIIESSGKNNPENLAERKFAIYHRRWQGQIKAGLLYFEAIILGMQAWVAITKQLFLNKGSRHIWCFHCLTGFWRNLWIMPAFRLDDWEGESTMTQSSFMVCWPRKIPIQDVAIE